MTTELPKHERALTDEEKADFLKELSDLTLEYGVEIYCATDESFSQLKIEDRAGNTLFACSSFLASDAATYGGTFPENS